MTIKNVKFRKQKGVALILTLWLIVLLTIIGGSHARNVRLETQMTNNHLAKTNSRMLAQTGLSRAILELFVNDPEQRWSFDGTNYKVIYETGSVDIKIQNSAGLINLNSSPPQLLTDLFNAIGLDDAASDSLVASILDWRDSDDLIRINGAEDTAYKLENLDYGTPDRDFRSLDELRYVMGMTGDIYKKIRPYLTIYSKSGGLNSNQMPSDLNELLSGMADDNDASLIDDEVDFEEESTVVGGDNLVGVLNNVFHITVRAIHEGNAVTELLVVVDVGVRQGERYRLRMWDETVRQHEVNDA